MKTMEHPYGRLPYVILGAICGLIKWTYLELNFISLSDWYKLGSAIVVAGSCGAASKGGAMVVTWGVKYFKEYRRNRKIKSFYNRKK